MIENLSISSASETGKSINKLQKNISIDFKEALSLELKNYSNKSKETDIKGIPKTNTISLNPEIVEGEVQDTNYQINDTIINIQNLFPMKENTILKTSGNAQSLEGVVKVNLIVPDDIELKEKGETSLANKRIDFSMDNSKGLLEKINSMAKEETNNKQDTSKDKVVIKVKDKVIANSNILTEKINYNTGVKVIEPVVLINGEGAIVDVIKNTKINAKNNDMEQKNISAPNNATEEQIIVSSKEAKAEATKEAVNDFRGDSELIYNNNQSLRLERLFNKSEILGDNINTKRDGKIVEVTTLKLNNEVQEIKGNTNLVSFYKEINNTQESKSIHLDKDANTTEVKDFSGVNKIIESNSNDLINVRDILRESVTLKTNTNKDNGLTNVDLSVNKTKIPELLKNQGTKDETGSKEILDPSPSYLQGINSTKGINNHTSNDYNTPIHRGEDYQKENIQKIQETIITNMNTLSQGKVSVMKVKLSPEELGVVDVELRLEGGKITGKIIVENEHVKQMFSDKIHDISQGLKQQNIEVTDLKIDMSFNGGSSKGNNSGSNSNKGYVIVSNNMEEKISPSEKGYNDTSEVSILA